MTGTSFGSLKTGQIGRTMRRSVAEEGPDPIDRFVGGRIRTRRLGMRISQTKLGHSIGVTFQQIQKYESGTNRVGASNLYRIAEALGVEVAYFFEGLAGNGEQHRSYLIPGLAEPDMPSFDADPLSTKESCELMHNYYRIPDPRVRKTLFQLVRTLSNNQAAE